MMKKSLVTLFSILLLVVGMTPVAEAVTPAQLKARMSERLGKIVALKQTGAVGEDNKGFLSPRGSLSAAESAMVKAENLDRRAVYGIIAGRTKSAVSTVGKTRAKSIRSSAPSGTWVQMPDGSWKKA